MRNGLYLSLDEGWGAGQLARGLRGANGTRLVPQKR